MARDVEDLKELLDDVRLREWLGVDDAAALRERFRRWESRSSPDESESWLNWVVQRAADGTAVGWVQATVKGQSASIAYAMLPSHRGHGYATAAARAVVEWLGGYAIEARIDPDNKPSAAVARAAGLEPTERVVDGEVVWELRGA